MGLSVVAEQDEFEPLQAARRVRFADEAQPLPQGEYGGAPHARIDHQRAYPSRSAASSFPTEQVIAVLSAIGAILGARLALFLAGLGVYLLGSQAAEGGSIWPMVAFGGFVVLPLVWLSSQRNL